MPTSRREPAIAEPPRQETPDDSREFLQSLADVVERVNALVQRQHDADQPGDRPRTPTPEWADTEPAELDPADELAAATVMPYGIDLALDLAPEAPPPASAPAGMASGARSGRRPLLVALIASLALGVAGADFLWSHHAKTSAPVTLSLDSLPPPAAAPAPRTSPPALTRWIVDSDADASTESAMLAQLAQAVRADREALADAGGATPPTLGIARYDALQAQPSAWRVVAPLDTEEVYAIVRADSPLRHLDDLRGRRIDMGEAGSARAQSGAALYRRLFDAALPAGTASGLPRDDALQRLLAGGDVDAVLVFDGQPSAWLAGLPDRTRSRLRLLELAPDRPASRRALQAYLPASVAPLTADRGGAPVSTLGVVTFLVASAQAPDVEPLARALCARLPALRRTGHPKWREVQPALQLPTGLPVAAGAAAGLIACAAPLTPSSRPPLDPGVRS